MLRRPSPRWPVFVVLAAAGLFAGLALAALFALPQITAFSPVAGAQDVSAHAPIRLNFNLPMDHASVEGALRLSPSLAGTFTWEDKTLRFTPGPPWPLNTIVTVTVAGGRAKSQRGLPLLGEHSWTFTIGSERIVYLAGAVPNLWVLSLDGGASPRPITSETFGVYDFDVSPDGTRLIYAALRADGGADLRTVNVEGTSAADFLACAGVACLSPAFSPDGKRVAYERHTLVTGLAGEVTFGDPHVHVYTLARGVDEDLDAADAGRQTRFPRWGPDGRLRYLDSSRQALVIHDLASGAVTYIPDSSGDIGTWSPDGQFIVYPEIFFPPETTPGSTPLPGGSGTPEGEGADKFFSHLLRVTIATNQTQNLSGEGVVEDASPVYSPSGEWLAFAHKGLDPGQWTPGRQLWLMRADGSDAHALTREPFYNHSAFVWSPDGKALVYMRKNAADPSVPAEIWTINADGASARQLVSGGYLPAWLP